MKVLTNNIVFSILLPAARCTLLLFSLLSSAEFLCCQSCIFFYLGFLPLPPPPHQVSHTHVQSGGILP